MKLGEEIYMEQPTNFEVKGNAHKMCQLKRSFMVLKNSLSNET